MTGNRDLLRHTDWAATPLGPMTQWPARMRAVVEMAIDSGFPVATVWGEDAIQIYNDAYNPIYGDKHPGGGPFAKHPIPPDRPRLAAALSGCGRYSSKGVRASGCRLKPTGRSE